MKKILWVSPYAPYDKVNHAGGQTENYYVKGIKDKGFDLKLLSFCTSDEVDKLDLNEYGIDNDIIVLYRDVLSKIARTFKYNIFDSKYNPFNKYGNLVSNNFLKEVRKHIEIYQKKGYVPDIVILEWTESALLLKDIKKIFPDAKFLCIEEDVAYLGYKRHLQYTKGIINKAKWKLRYKNLKREELDSLNKAEYVGCLNDKDYRLLCSDGIKESKIFSWIPYFTHYNSIKRQPDPKCKIMFFGNMAREENYKSVIWFIENVIPLISEIDFEFNIVGAKPANVLKKYENEKVHVVGFVDDVSPFFQESLCLVAPLVLGAGIKIKILESMSAGLPVLTNEIGIEGIPAKQNKDYIFCTKPEDYANEIRKLHHNRKLVEQFSKNARSFVNKQYNIDNSLDDLCELLKSI